MKTDAELDALARSITEGYGDAATQRKLLRSVELDAWREARELVEKHRVRVYADEPHIPNPSLAEMDRIIQQLQLQLK